jgi:hypothetical protein
LIKIGDVLIECEMISLKEANNKAAETSQHPIYCVLTKKELRFIKE